MAVAVLEVAGREDDRFVAERGQALQHLGVRQARQELHGRPRLEARRQFAQAGLEAAIHRRGPGHDHHAARFRVPAQRLFDGSGEVEFDGHADHVGRQRRAGTHGGRQHAHVHQRTARKDVGTIRQQEGEPFAGQDDHVRHARRVLVVQVAAQRLLVGRAAEARHVEILVDDQHRPVDRAADDLPQTPVTLDVGGQQAAARIHDKHGELALRRRGGRMAQHAKQQPGNPSPT